MGPDYTARFYCRLFLLLALGNAAVLRPEVLPGENLPSSEDLCPCLARAECRREFGMRPEDESLLSFPPCQDPDSARCCGASAEQPPPSPGIVIPIPAVVPEYLDAISSTISPRYEEDTASEYDYYEGDSEEAITDAEIDVGEAGLRPGGSPTSEIIIPSVKSAGFEPPMSLKGENIGASVSQADASAAMDYPDQRGENEHVKGAAQTSTGTEERGEIYAERTGVGMGEKIEGIVGEGHSDVRATGNTPEFARDDDEKLDAGRKSGSDESTDSGVETGRKYDSRNDTVEDVNSVDYTTEINHPTPGPSDDLRDDSRRETAVKNQRDDAETGAGTSGIEESGTSGVAENGAGDEMVETSGPIDATKATPALAIREPEGAADSRGKPDYRTRGPVPNQHRFQLAATKEPRNVEETVPPYDESVATAGDKQAKPVTIANFYGKRRRPAIAIPRVASGSVTETPLRPRALKRRPLRLGESGAPDAQGSESPLHVPEPEIVTTTTRPAPELRRPPSIRSRMLSAHRRRASARQQNPSTRDDSYLEMTTASILQAVTPSAEEPSRVETSSEVSQAENSADESNSETNSTPEIYGSSLGENGASNADETASDFGSDLTLTIDGTNRNLQSSDNVVRESNAAVDGGQQRETSPELERQALPIETRNSWDGDTASISSMSDSVSGKHSARGEAVSGSLEAEGIGSPAAGFDAENARPVLVGSRTYVPFLINTELLGDPATGLSQSDMLLSLSCGSVVFGRDSRDGKTLVCDVPKDVNLGIGAVEGPMLGEAVTAEADDRIANRDAEESLKTMTAEAAKDDRRMPSKRSRGRQTSIQTRAAELENREGEMGDGTARQTARGLSRGRIRHRTAGRRSGPETGRINAVGEDGGAVEPRRLSALDSRPDFDVPFAEEYETAREPGARNSRSYVPISVPILPRARDEDVPEVKVGKKKTGNSSREKKLSVKELGAARMGADSGSLELVNNRNSRQAIEFAPENKRVTISPDDLSMTGRISVVGLLPAGFKDPALEAREDELGIDLPRDSFRPSPVDPIHWP